VIVARQAVSRPKSAKEIKTKAKFSQIQPNPAKSSQIEPNPAKPGQRESKALTVLWRRRHSGVCAIIPGVNFDFLVRIEPFQGLARTPQGVFSFFS
jgi:hypothetical protein